MSRSTILLIICALMATAAVAQKPADLKRNGEKAFENGRWAEARTLLAQYQEAKPGDFNVLTKLGIANFHLSQGAEARRFLEYVAAKLPDSKDPDLFYYLAQTLQGLGEWEKAIAAYKSFLHVAGEKHPLRENAADNIRRCVSGMGIAENNDVALVESIGAAINTPGDEFAPLPSVNYPDKFYFAAARKGCNGGLRNDERYEDNEPGHWSSDMFSGKLTNSGWELAGSLGGLLNSSRFEIPLGFNANGQVLYFFRGFTTFSGEILADTAAKKDEYSLQPPAFNSPMKPEEGDCAPYFFNEKTIVFASRRAGGFGGLDLWYTVFADTAWSEPVNLGQTINSAYDETTPFLAHDGRNLYFSSNRVESMGGLDIYNAVFDDVKKEWTAARNMGAPVNSPEDDAYFRLTSDGLAALFSSNRLGGQGERDIYITYFKEAVAAQTTHSKPALFFQIGRENTAATVIAPITIPAILYDTDRDLLSADNVKILEQAAATARQHPETNVVLTIFTEDSGQSKFDLYYGIKRAETLGKALTDRGVAANRMVLRSVGSAYPIARIIVNGAPNPFGMRVNKRAEIALTTIEPLNFEFKLDRPGVPEDMAASGINALDEQSHGLTYKVEAVVTRQILTNDALAMFGEMMIETQPGTGAYQYTAGYFKQFEKAAQLRKELTGAGFTDARVVAYVNGIRISKAEAVGLVKKYPDLATFVRG